MLMSGCRRPQAVEPPNMIKSKLTANILNAIFFLVGYRFSSLDTYESASPYFGQEPLWGEDLPQPFSALYGRERCHRGD